MPGIVFLTLDAGSAVVVPLARAAYRLAYRRARVVTGRPGDEISVHSRGASGSPREFAARWEGIGTPAPAEPGSRDHWLLERYCAYTGDRRGVIRRMHIHHRPWMPRPARAEVPVNTLASAFGIALQGEPVAHAVDRMDVLVWPPERARPRA